MDIETIYSDETKEQDGVWHPYRDCSRVLVASISNRRFQQFMEALRKPYRRQIELGIMPRETATDLTCKAMARYIVLGWEGFTAHGKHLEYSEEACRDLLARSRTFRDDMAQIANNEDAYHQELDEATAKNSGRRSGGTSKSAPSVSTS